VVLSSGKRLHYHFLVLACGANQTQLVSDPPAATGGMIMMTVMTLMILSAAPVRICTQGIVCGRPHNSAAPTQEIVGFSQVAWIDGGG
jgi:hypothetical protein